MQIIRQFSSWFLTQNFIGKVVIGFSGLYILFCLFSVPIALINSSTPKLAPTQDLAVVYTQAYETAWASWLISNTTPLSPTIEYTSTPIITPTQEYTLTPLFTPTLEFTPYPPLPLNASCIPPNNSREIALVVGIVDGDTIDVLMNNQTYRVRYIGIDTPENGQPNYWLSTEKNQTLVYTKSVTMIKDVSDTDRYGRLLRYVLLGETFVNNELVRLGFASAYRYPPDTSCADQFDIAQSQGQLNQIGIWQPTLLPSGGGGKINNGGSNCDPSYPDICLKDGIGDYDCAGGSGNGPNYIKGPFRVIPPDPFGLDRDGDGLGCE